MKKPVICVSAGSSYNPKLEEQEPRKVVSSVAYPHAIALGGGIPVLTGEDCAEELAQLCDGLLLTGGKDVCPESYGETSRFDNVITDPKRDEYEIALCRAFIAAGKPILGICRGMQIINAVLGGTLYQDLPSETGVKHFLGLDVHPIRAEEDSALAAIFGTDFLTNSTHHQAVKKLGDGLRITARALDGTVEAVEHTAMPIWATQFHPEKLTGIGEGNPTPDFLPWFTWFVNRVAAQKGAVKD